VAVGEARLESSRSGWSRVGSGRNRRHDRRRKFRVRGFEPEQGEKVVRLLLGI
jgi:hypothetical protein